ITLSDSRLRDSWRAFFQVCHAVFLAQCTRIFWQPRFCPGITDREVPAGPASSNLPVLEGAR
ncbi:unnamed protein product, partial [Amoebophrya sp. A120]